MSTTDRDDELSKRLADTLERSLDSIDSATLMHLVHARQEALGRRTRLRRTVVGLALAASVAAVAVVPWYVQQRATTTTAEADMSYLAVDPQMLSDMDMLLALGESDVGA